MKLVRSEYLIHNGKPVVYLFIREGNTRIIKKDDSLVPYFYIPYDEHPLSLKTDNKKYKALDGTILKKVFCTLPEDVKKWRDQFKPNYEADILFPNRYLIDKVEVIEPTIPKILFIDIETDNHGKIPNIKIANEPIICITCYDNLTDIYTTFVWRSDVIPGQTNDVVSDCLHEINYYRKEEDMLVAFSKYILDSEVDIMTGWFSNSFDIPYIINRMLGVGLDPGDMSCLGQAYIRNDGEPVIRGIALMDLLDVYKKFTFNLEESYSLNFIAKKTIGQVKTGTGDVRNIWRKNLEELIKYNTNDTILIVEINKKRRLFEFVDEIRRMCWSQYEDVLMSSRITDQYILKMFHNRIVFPSKKYHKIKEFEGAIIKSYCQGIKEWVVDFDIRSLYPSIMLFANLSSECIVDTDTKNCIKAGKIIVDMSRKGFFTEVVSTLFEERQKYKRMMKTETIGSDKYNLYYNRQYALKTLLNALYGQTGFSGSRYADIRIAETVTYLGRKIETWTEEYLKSLGLDVLYMDTDSTFWTSNKELSIMEIEAIRKKVNASYDDFMVKEFGHKITHNLEIEFDKLFRKAFFGTSRKRYSGHVIYEAGQKVDYLHVTGFEIRRSDSSQFSRNLQSTIFDMILRKDKNKEEVMEFISNEIEKLRVGNFRYTEIGIPKGITKELGDYVHPAANIRGAKYSTDRLGLQLSNKPKMLYVNKMPEGFPETDVICFDEDVQIPPGTQIDINKMIDKLVKDKIDTIFEALGWGLGELESSWVKKVKRSKKDEEQVSLFGEEVLNGLIGKNSKGKRKVKK